MPVSGNHEALIELVTIVPGLLARLVEHSCGTPIPAHTAVVPSSEAATIKVPLELRSDAVRVFTDDAGTARLAVVVEVQRQSDHDKYWVWPVLLAHARRLHKCAAALLAVVPDHTTAAWARQPIDLGLARGTVRPLVVNLQELPPIADIAAASENIGYAMLAALPQRKGNDHLDVVAAALDKHDLKDAAQYSGLMMTALKGAARDYWRKLMTAGTYAYSNEYAQELFARGESQGEAKGEAQAILLILDARGITVPEATATRIRSCTSPAQLETWITRATHATELHDVFAED